MRRTNERNRTLDQVQPARSLPTYLNDDGLVRLHMPGWKRGLDLCCLIMGLPALLILMSVIALAIKWASPGPIFFRQERIGFRGRRFICWKFRTMRVDADEGVHEQHLRRLMLEDVPMTKMDQHGDPRLIPLGALLRSSGLDELPQVFNVLKGEMSIVGPRPCMPYEFEQYEPWHRRRCDTLPGLTGLWQVCGKNRTTFNEMMDLDIYYAHNLSFSMDVKIMLKTVKVLLDQITETTQHHKKKTST